MDRNDHVDLVALRLKFVTRWIDRDIEKAFRHIKPLHKLGPLLHVSGHKWQCFLELRVSLSRWSHHVVEEFVGGLSRVPIKHNRAQRKPRAFGNVQPQAAPRFNDVVHVHFRVAVLPIKNFEKEGQIVGASRA